MKETDARVIADHPLDRPVWSALTGRQSAFACRNSLALRFRPEVSPLAAAMDSSAVALAALRDLAGEDEELWQLEKDPGPIPAGMELVREAACLQMIAHSVTAGRAVSGAIGLEENDAEDMLALATLTAPGPFRIGTYQIGGFTGIRHEGRLVAMAGERTKPGEFTEVSGVCTHPDFRGRGYAGFLMREVTSAILDRGETPFLHCYATNQSAITLYESLGFRVFQQVMARVIRRGTASSGA